MWHVQCIFKPVRYNSFCKNKFQELLLSYCSQNHIDIKLHVRTSAGVSRKSQVASAVCTEHDITMIHIWFTLLHFLNTNFIHGEFRRLCGKMCIVCNWITYLYCELRVENFLMRHALSYLENRTRMLCMLKITYIL